LHALQNYPLEAYSSLAQKLKVSPQTMIRRVNSLQNKGILRYPIASFVPERIGLARYSVVFNISQLHQFTLLQNALSEYNYIRAYNRFYGERFGIYALFDLPQNINGMFNKFLEYLVEEEFCESYTIFKSTGHRFSSPAPLPNYTSEPETFKLVEFWQKRLQKSSDLVNGVRSAVTVKNGKIVVITEDGEKPIEPLHFLLLRDLTSHSSNGKQVGIRTKQTELIEYYREYYQHLGKKIRLTETENHFYYNLSEFFDTRNGHNTKVDFGRKYYNIVKNYLISNPRWNFVRKSFEEHVARAYIIEDVSEKEKAQFFNFISEETPPFNTGIELLDRSIFLRLTLPPYYDSKFSYLLWSTFKDHKIYSLDYFGEHGNYYTFYIDNFDWNSSNWRTDEDWLFNSVVEKIDEKLKNGNFGDFNLHKHITNGNGSQANGHTNGNGSAIYRHISNGSSSKTVAYR
jgi:DNA-binding Lrp family transcriptional regulator